MSYGIFSDVHSNWEALSVVLEYLERQKVDSYICCGDIVGYGPDPNKCVEKIFSLKNLSVVPGNHDKAAIGQKDLSWFNSSARLALIWTIKQLSSENAELLNKLPTTIAADNFTAVHGSARAPIDEYLYSSIQCEENLNLFSTPVLFCGHTHIPFIYSSEDRKSNLSAIETENIFFLTGEKNIINVGSVGQPRDGDNRACCVIYNVANKEIKFIRLEYNFALTQQKMMPANLPASLIERLTHGM